MDKKKIMDYLLFQIDKNNYGMLSSYKVSFDTLKYIRNNNISVKSNTVFQGDTPIFHIVRKYASKKVNGMYKELKPVLEAV